MSGIGVIVNPRSRRNKKDPRSADRLARILGDRGVVRTARSSEDLGRIAEEFQKLEIDVLGISGGDGTSHVTLSGFIEAYGDTPLPAIALLRGGTMNTVANSVGVPRGGPERLLKALTHQHACRSFAPLPYAERRVMHVGSHVGFIFGTGAIHGFIAAYYENPDPDPIWAAKVLARGMASAAVGGEFVRRMARRWEGKVTFDDGSSLPDRDYLAIGAGTVEQIGLGFRPFYRANVDHGAFHLLGIHTSALGFIQKLPSVYRALPMGETHTYDRAVRGAVLEARGGVVDYMCDGDIHSHKGPLEISLGPVVRIVLGPGAAGEQARVAPAG